MSDNSGDKDDYQHSEAQLLECKRAFEFIVSQRDAVIEKLAYSVSVKFELKFAVDVVLKFLCNLARDYDVPFCFAVGNNPHELRVTAPSAEELISGAQRIVDGKINIGTKVRRDDVPLFITIREPVPLMSQESEIVATVAKNCLDVEIREMNGGYFVAYPIRGGLTAKAAQTALTKALENASLDGEVFIRVEEKALFIGSRDEDTLHNALLQLSGLTRKQSGAKGA